jgi:hypothetical protein
VTTFRTVVFALGMFSFTSIGVATPVAAENEVQHRNTLEKLRDQDLWGEVVLDQGRVRQIRVQSISGDTVSVREVVGPFQERGAMYTLSQFHAVRELGDFRISQRRSAYRPEKSLLTGLLFEIAVPGGGYYYAGETKQAFVLVLVSAAAAATAIKTGSDGAAGWVPVMAWTKVASLLHLADEIGASNAAHGPGEGSFNTNGDNTGFFNSPGGTRWSAKSKASVLPLVQLRHSF